MKESLKCIIQLKVIMQNFLVFMGFDVTSFLAVYDRNTPLLIP